MTKIKERIMAVLFLLCASVSIISVVLICAFLFGNGVPAIFKIGVFEFIFGTIWKPENNLYGIFPMILGSIYVTAGAIIMGVPVGVFTATFLAYFCPEKLYKIVKPAINLLAGIPSVVYGFFGLVVIVPLIHQLFGVSGSTMLTASLLLAIMVLPTIITMSETSIRAVPKSYYEGALALGASHERSVFFVVLPAAKQGVFSSIILGVGRVIGETMAVIMVAGNQARLPQGVLKGVRTMTANIVIEMGYATDLHREALIATAVVLFVFILLINFSFSLLKNSKR